MHGSMAACGTAYLLVTRETCKHGAFFRVAGIVASFVPTECPAGRGMWAIFGKPLKRGIWSTLGLHAVLTICLV